MRINLKSEEPKKYEVTTGSHPYLQPAYDTLSMLKVRTTDLHTSCIARGLLRTRTKIMSETVPGECLMSEKANRRGHPPATRRGNGGIL
jgi:hypothetical protein